MNIKLSDFVNDNINCLKVYFSKENSNIIGWKNIEFNIPFVTKATKMKTKMFHNKDMIYVYDVQTDGQKVVKKKFISDKNVNNLYIIGYNKEILPTHLFPCTDEIVYSIERETDIYRINNRMFIYVEKEDTIQYIYIKYNHNNTIDLSKMQTDIMRTISWIRRNVSLEPI